MTTAYVAQTDPYFSTLKDWGKAIYDLWLHNGGSAPILMASLGGGAEPPPPPCVAPATPLNLNATAGKRRVTLTWNPVSGVSGYKVYYSQGGKYTFRATVSTPSYSYTDGSLSPASTYCYAVTAFLNCTGGTVGESGYSGTACAVLTR